MKLTFKPSSRDFLTGGLIFCCGSAVGLAQLSLLCSAAPGWRELGFAATYLFETAVIMTTAKYSTLGGENENSRSI